MEFTRGNTAVTRVVAIYQLEKSGGVSSITTELNDGTVDTVFKNR
nr:hypothetical protein [Nocardia amamiensis]